MVNEYMVFEYAARNVHIVMLVICLGLAAFADITAAKSISKPLTDNCLAKLHNYHNALTTGLVLLWISGLTIIWFQTSFNVAEFSPKLIAKLAVVTLLTVNAGVIGRFALQAFETHRDRTFGELRFTLRLSLALSAAMSSGSWVSAFCLGAIKELKTASPDLLLNVLCSVYGVFVAGALFIAFFAGAGKATGLTSTPAEFLVRQALPSNGFRRFSTPTFY